MVANLGRLEKLQEGQLDKLIEGLVGYRRYLKVKGSAVGMRVPGRVLGNEGVVCLGTIDTSPGCQSWVKAKFDRFSAGQ